MQETHEDLLFSNMSLDFPLSNNLSPPGFSQHITDNMESCSIPETSIVPLFLEFAIISMLHLFVPLILPTTSGLQDCTTQAGGWLFCRLDILGAPHKPNSFPRLLLRGWSNISRYGMCCLWNPEKPARLFCRSGCKTQQFTFYFRRDIWV